MADLEELYQEILMDHANHPRCREELADAEVDAEAYNPLCGDRVRFAVQLAEGAVQQVRFDGEGCAICMATASIAGAAGRGRSTAAARALCDEMVAVVKGTAEVSASASRELAAVAGVRRFPMRTKCAILPWQALRSAIDNQQSGDSA